MAGVGETLTGVTRGLINQLLLQPNRISGGLLDGVANAVLGESRRREHMRLDFLRSCQGSVALIGRFPRTNPPEQNAFLAQQAVDILSGSNPQGVDLISSRKFIGVRPLITTGLAEEPDISQQSPESSLRESILAAGGIMPFCDKSSLFRNTTKPLQSAILAKGVGRCEEFTPLVLPNNSTVSERGLFTDMLHANLGELEDHADLDHDPPVSGYLAPSLILVGNSSRPPYLANHHGPHCVLLV